MDAYNAAVKRSCRRKARQNAVLGALARVLGVRAGDHALVLDAETMASSSALRAATSLRQKDVTVVNYATGDGVVASMRRRALAAVVAANVNHYVHVMPLDAPLRIAYLDYCCVAETIEEAGTVPAVVARMTATRAPCLLGLTFSRRNRKTFKKPQPHSMQRLVQQSAALAGYTVAWLYVDAYTMYHLQALLVPRDDAAAAALVATARAAVRDVVAIPTADSVESEDSADVKDSADSEESVQVLDTAQAKAALRKWRVTKRAAKVNSTRVCATAAVGTKRVRDGDTAPKYDYRSVFAARRCLDGKWRYRVWWRDCSITWEPATSFDACDAATLERLRQRECKRRRVS